MAVKKFFLTFTIIIFVFLVGAGIALIQVLNSAEARAAEEIQTAIDNEVDVPGNTEEQNDDVLKTFYDIDSFNALLLVRDKVGANTDAIMLVNMNNIDNTISVMSIPRDTITSTDLNKDGEDNDIMNMVYANHGLDIEETIKYIGNELGCEIKYGAVMNLNVVSEVIDQLGGVDFDVPALMDYDDPYQDLHIYFEPGLQFFDGEDAVKLLRFRKNNEGVDEPYWNGSDIKRIEMQQAFLQELLKQKSSLFYPWKINSLISLVFDNLDTNITTGEIAKYVAPLTKINLGEIQFLTLPTHDDVDFIHLIPEHDAIKEYIDEYFKTIN